MICGSVQSRTVFTILYAGKFFKESLKHFRGYFENEEILKLLSELNKNFRDHFQGYYGKVSIKISEEFEKAF